MSGLTYGELFAGYDGLGMGIRSVLGGETRWYAEFDAAPSKILAHHHPSLPNLGDVTKVDWASVEPVDVITGGSPCQDLSHAGKRAGMKAGTRSGLWASMCDAIETIRPKLVVWENVRGAYSAEATSAVEPCPICVGDGGRVSLRALGRVLGDLAELGYDARWYGLRAADVGAAHGRFRVFLFATPADSDLAGLQERRYAGSVRASSPGAPAAADGDRRESPSVPGQLTLLGTPRCADGMQHDLREEVGNPRGRLEDQVSLLPTPSAADGNGGGRSNSPGHQNTLPGTVREHLLPTPRATDGTKGGPNQRGSSGDLMLPSAVQKMLPTPTVGDSKSARNSTATRHVLPPTGIHAGDTLTDALVPKLLPTPNVADAVKGGFDHKGGNPTLRGATEDTAREQDWREYESAIRRQEAAFGRPAPLPTEPGAKGQPRLSPRFVEWLMGLPEGHVTDPAIGISRNDQLKALGNGVVPQQAAAATRAFLHDTQAAS